MGSLWTFPLHPTGQDWVTRRLRIVNYQESARHRARLILHQPEGNWRPRQAQEVIEVSCPWRAKLRRMGEDAFSYDLEIAAKFAAVNATRPIDEERQEMRALLSLIKTYLASAHEISAAW